MIDLNNSLITIWGKIKQLKNDIFSDIAEIQTDLGAETLARENAISGLSSSLLLKEDTLNKVNEIVSDATLKKYNTAHSIYTALEQINATLQSLGKSIPYVLQALGDSETDVVSQKLFTEVIKGLSSGIHYKDDVATQSELPEEPSNGDLYHIIDTDKWVFWVTDSWKDFGGLADLSIYATSSQVHAAIFDVIGIGGLETLITANQASIIGAINEVKGQTENNKTSISGLQSALSDEASTRSDSISGLASQVNTNKTDIANIKTELDLTLFENYMTLNPINL